MSDNPRNKLDELLRAHDEARGVWLALTDLVAEVVAERDAAYRHYIGTGRAYAIGILRHEEETERAGVGQLDVSDVSPAEEFSASCTEKAR